MCGITGVFSFKERESAVHNCLEKAVEKLHNRGPDDTGIYQKNHVGLGQSRLSIIDTSDAGHQPFSSKDNNVHIVFNGEFYNFGAYREKLIKEGVEFRSQSDTEVLLQLYIIHGIDFIEKVNGCFAFAIYDETKDCLYIARDRMGIKPLYYYKNDNHIIFGSELKALLAYPIPREIDQTSLFHFFEQHYIPPPYSIFQNVYKLSPGKFLKINSEGMDEKTYYRISQAQTDTTSSISYDAASKELVRRLDRAVEKRLIADVPLGAFLSGGIDSSVIVGLASQHTKHLNTFSIGFKDEAFFDETNYANLVAKKFQTNHTVFSLSNDDVFGNLFKVLDYIDEPFADSSALAVHILSEYTRQKVTVALSGDGADEMFAGYNKHMAHYKAMQEGIRNPMISSLKPLWQILPKSRQNKITNLFRQLERFSDGLHMNPEERYWRWCSFATEQEVRDLLQNKYEDESAIHRKKEILKRIYHSDASINEVLYADMHHVLPGDMLTKVDMMSMANSLEVRTPFLDHDVVDFVFSLPGNYKISPGQKKKILQDSFRKMLPAELYNRPKHGFEIPLLNWFRKDLTSYLEKEVFDTDFVMAQKIFEPNQIKHIRKKLFSKDPGDVHLHIWSLLVFQHWWKKYMQ